MHLEWQPLTNESSISLDWSLPLTETSQFLLFNRVLGDFQKDTSLVDTASKKRYRKKEEDLLLLRNLFSIWGQIREHILSSKGAQELEAKEKNLLALIFSMTT